MSSSKRAETKADAIAPSQDDHKSRPIRACDNCQRRKSRCDLGRPSCGSCRLTDRKCLYSARKRKPGPRQGSTHATKSKSRAKCNAHGPISSLTTVTTTNAAMFGETNLSPNPKLLIVTSSITDSNVFNPATDPSIPQVSSAVNFDASKVLEVKDFLENLVIEVPLEFMPYELEDPFGDGTLDLSLGSVLRRTSASPPPISKELCLCIQLYKAAVDTCESPAVLLASMMAIEVKRRGLTKLYSPNDPKAASVDVIFVHGLFGHPRNTWSVRAPKPQGSKAVKLTSQPRDWTLSPRRLFRQLNPFKDNSTDVESQPNSHLSYLQHEEVAQEPASASPQSPGENEPTSAVNKTQVVFWPHDLLPSVLGQASIYTWGYDVDINRMFQSVGRSSVFQHATTLLSDVSDERMTPEDKTRPLIFVAHSLGGIIVKEALQQSRAEKTYLREILPATFGVCFLGTPHRGSQTATLAKIAFDISKMFLQKSATPVLRDLEVNSSTLERIGKSFSQILADRKIQVHSFAEELPTAGIVVVQNFSYSIGDAYETTSTIPSSHANMGKFSSMSDTGFLRVSKVLQRWEADIHSLNLRSINTEFQSVAQGTRKDAITVAYEEALNRIDLQPLDQRELANTVLNWVIHAARPLSVKEIQHAVPIISGNTVYNEETIIGSSAGLLEIDPESHTVRLVHKLERDFLENLKETRFRGGHVMILKRSIAYLSQDEFATGPCLTKLALILRLQSYPFVRYAAQELGYHARQEPQRKNQAMVLEFLKERRYFPSVGQIVLIGYTRVFSAHYMRTVSELDISAFLGLDIACTELLQAGFDVNRRDALDYTPLHRAASKGHTHVVKLLLDNNADATANTFDLQPVLGYAAMFGHEPIVRMLLEKRADRKMKPPEKERALIDSNSHKPVYMLLRKHFFDDPLHNTVSSVHIKAFEGDTVSLERLLADGVDINLKCIGGQTALHIAVSKNHISTVELLLDNGADVTATDCEGSTALFYARDNIPMLRILIAKRRDQVNSVIDWYRKTTLIYMAWIGNFHAVKFLLSEGVDVSICDLWGATALQYAAEGGHLAVVEALFAAGSDVRRLDTGGRTPLRCAELEQHLAVKDFLAPKTGTVKFVLGWTELHYASWTGHWLLVIRYVVDGWDISAQDRNGATPLHLAARRGHLVVVKYLLAAGADRQALDKEYRTPLGYARQYGKDVVAQYLSGINTGVEVRDEEQRTPWEHIQVREGGEEQDN